MDSKWDYVFLGANYLGKKTLHTPAQYMQVPLKVDPSMI